MTRVYAAIWSAALAFAAAAIALLLSFDGEMQQQFPSGYPPIEDADIVFIGSSLAGHALPNPEPASGMLGDGRSCAILYVPAISEQFSTRLLAYALDSGAETVFIEINAYAHDYLDLTEPALLRVSTLKMRELGGRLAANARTLLHLDSTPNHVVDCSGAKADKTLDPETLSPHQYYAFRMIEPTHREDMRKALELARESGAEIFFFSPPRPKSAADRIGAEAFADFNAHIEAVAESFGLPVWYSAAPWPDDHFMDILAHTNERGRNRFREELARWYQERE